MGCNRSQSTGPSLKETTDWINDTYNPRPDEISYKNHGVNSSELTKDNTYETQDERTTTMRIEGCVATIEEKQLPGLPLSKDVVLMRARQTFNMGDIDPSRIKIEKTASHEAALMCSDANPNLTCDQADIGLHTHNDRPLIKVKRMYEYPDLKGSDHNEVNETTEDSAYLFVNDLDYLPRFVAALKREIELCGGKPSAF